MGRRHHSLLSGSHSCMAQSLLAFPLLPCSYSKWSPPCCLPTHSDLRCLAELPLEALGHSEWEWNDLFPVRQWDKAQSGEAKGFNQINVPFVISLSALSVCVSVCHLLSVCWLSHPLSVCFICSTCKSTFFLWIQPSCFSLVYFLWSWIIPGIKIKY